LHAGLLLRELPALETGASTPKMRPAQPHLNMELLVSVEQPLLPLFSVGHMRRRHGEWGPLLRGRHGDGEVVARCHRRYRHLNLPLAQRCLFQGTEVARPPLACPCRLLGGMVLSFQGHLGLSTGTALIEGGAVDAIGEVKPRNSDLQSRVYGRAVAV
jgi:hypothetical protein